MTSTTPDFAAAIRSLRVDIPYKHHGRTQEEGIDCFGLMFLLYRMVGRPIDHIDIPYGVRDIDRPHRIGRITDQLFKEFEELPKVSWRELRDGDVLLLGDKGKEHHMSLVADGVMAQMAGGMERVNGEWKVTNGRLRIIPLGRAWPFIGRVFRFREEK